MRIILFIQSLIILFGAGYWYIVVRPYLQAEKQPVEVEVTAPVREQTQSTSEQPEVVEETNYATSTIKYDETGPTDTGMEFPIVDDGIEVQL